MRESRIRPVVVRRALTVAGRDGYRRECAPDQYWLRELDSTRFDLLDSAHRVVARLWYSDLYQLTTQGCLEVLDETEPTS